jgi:hypothetical protein
MWWRYTLSIKKVHFNFKRKQSTYCTPIWLKELSNFIQRYKIKVETKIKWNQKQREKDEYIMDIPRKQGCIQKHIKQVHQVRMYLKVITLADIKEEMGTHIDAS